MECISNLYGVLVSEVKLAGMNEQLRWKIESRIGFKWEEYRENRIWFKWEEYRENCKKQKIGQATKGA